MKNWIKFVLAAVFLTGCASVETVNQGYNEVDYTDGISGVEAKRIAQRLLLGMGMEKTYAVSAPELDTDFMPSYPQWKGIAWVVCFSSKSLNPFNTWNRERFVAAVDKTTGNIRYYQYGGSMIPTEMHPLGEAGLPVEELLKQVRAR